MTNPSGTSSGFKRQPLPFIIDSPFSQALGYQLWRCENGVSEITLDVRPEMTNSWGVAHGGVVMTLLDVTMAHAARSGRNSLPALAPGVVTIEMKTSFMRPGKGLLTATGRVLHGSSRLAFCEGSVRDELGELCAHATGTFKYVQDLRHGGPDGPPAPQSPRPD